MDDVVAAVTTYNALPWIEQCLASLGGTATVVVDNGSSDGTVSFVRERFPAVEVVEQGNLGLAAGWLRGLEESRPSRWALILNADAWLVDDALERLVAVGDAHAKVAVVGPRLTNTDGSLQRSVRGFPTLWRLATEYLYLRKLGPRTDGIERVLRGGVRPCVGARGRVPHGSLPARSPRGDRRGRRPRPGLLPLQRGGRLALPVCAGRAGARCSRRTRRACMSEAPRTAAASSVRTFAASSVSSTSTTGMPRPRGCERSCGGRSRSGDGSSAASAARCTATAHAGSGRATSAR